jgi:hypothetical protein
MYWPFSFLSSSAWIPTLNGQCSMFILQPVILVVTYSAQFFKVAV